MFMTYGTSFKFSTVQNAHTVKFSSLEFSPTVCSHCFGIITTIILHNFLWGTKLLKQHNTKQPPHKKTQLYTFHLL